MNTNSNKIKETTPLFYRIEGYQNKTNLKLDATGRVDSSNSNEDKKIILENNFFIYKNIINIILDVKKYFLNIFSILEKEVLENFYLLINILKIFTFEDLLGNITLFICDCLSSDSLELSLLLFALIINFTKLSELFRKFLSHENSKKIYFSMYLVAIGIILAECLLLLTSPMKDISEQGILFLYIYITATLMLFLIFLTLTTCESYFSKEYANGNKYLRSEKLNNFVINIVSVVLPIIYFYFIAVVEIAHSYKLKLKIFESTQEINNFNFEENLINKRIDRNKNMFVDKPKIKNV